jgi:hypothetical protein
MSEIQFGKRYRLIEGIAENLDKYLTPLELIGNDRGTVSFFYNDEESETGAATTAWFNAHYELDEAEAAPDPVNNPAHYTQDAGIECIDAIKAALTPEEFRGYVKGNAIKYCWRERHKGGDEDLRKAGWYLAKAIDVVAESQSQTE